MPKKPKFKGFERANGELIKTAYFDGYAFGDRLLEGVMFRADIQPDGTLKVECAPGSEEYFSGLNEKKWLKAAREFAEENDCFLSKEEQSGDCEELYLLVDE